MAINTVDRHFLLQMISRLKGVLLEKTPPAILLDVQGVGYEVFVPMSTLYKLPEKGESVILHTHFVVREDVQQLFGFFEMSDRTLFRTLIKVNGVGPKMALAIMSGMEVKDLLRYVRTDNIKALSQIPGVGKKTAERLLIELRDKLASWQLDELPTHLVAGSQLTHDYLSEAESALIALGYKPVEAAKLVNAAAQQHSGATSEQLIRAALKSAVSG